MTKGQMKKNLKKSMAVFLALLCLPISALAAEGNWGLGFGTQGQQPTGNATAEELLQYNAYYVGNKAEKTIYLTFDGGYENGNTEKILDVLKETGVPAAFFMVGTYIRDNPDIVRRMAAEGHIVGNHTMHHKNMSAISDKETFAQELQGTEEQYKAVTGQEMPKYYRPPEGKYDVNNLQMASELGYTTVFWSLAYVDWYENDQPTKEQAFDKLIPRIHSGAVLLLHSTSQTNAEILKELIEKYKEMGYEFKTLNELTA